jgi:hypothetical protein
MLTARNMREALELASIERACWPERQTALRRAGIPTADQQTWQVLKNAYLPSATSAGEAHASSTLWGPISPAGDFVFPAGYFLPGLIFRITAAGLYSTTGTPALTLQLSTEHLAEPEVEPEPERELAKTAALTTVSGAAERTWHLEAIIRVLPTTDHLLTRGFVAGLTTGGINMLPAEHASSAGAEVKLANGGSFFLNAKWGTSSASNSITCDQWLIEQLD